MRRDLNMRKGKMIAQASHASMAFLTRRLVDARYDFVDETTHTLALSEEEEQWLNNSFVKICVSVNSESHLRLIEEAARAANIECHLITDDGRTEFHGIPTPTCLALGPDYSDRIDAITGNLPLL